MRVLFCSGAFYAFLMDEKEQMATEKRQMGERLRKARKDAGMSRSEATERLNQMGFRNKDGGLLGESRLGNYEQGLRMPDIVFVKALAKVYDTLPSRLLGFEEAPSEEEWALQQKYRQTDERGQKAVQSVADAQPAYGPVGEKDQATKAG